MEHESALPKGFRFDEYEIVRVLGAGGFGITYLGYDHNLDKPVAIKEYLPNDLAVRKGNTSVVAKSSVDQGDFAWGMERFLAEARALAQFDHPNIPKVHRFFETHGTGYIVMEYVEGETLSAHYKKHGSLPPAELKKIVLPLLQGLETIHATGYLHRDIKPANIVLRDDGSPVLIDFGSARAAIGAKSRSVTSIITPGYAPIEQYSSKGNQGPWTDIYALGAVLYRGVSGKIPDDATERLLNDELQPLAAARTVSGDDAFLSAIDWALQLRDKDRPQNCKQWRNRLVGENGGHGLAKRDAQVSDTQTSDVQAEATQRQENDPDSTPVPRPIVVAVIGAIITVAALVLWQTVPSYDEEQWQSVICEQREEVSLYLDEWPNGAYVNEARACLREIEAKHKAQEAEVAEAQREKAEAAEAQRKKAEAAEAQRKTEEAEAEPKAQQAEAKRKAQQAEARNTNAKNYTNSIGMVFTGIPAGSFYMGGCKLTKADIEENKKREFMGLPVQGVSCPSGGITDNGASDDELPQHKVHISRGFQMGVYEVTAGQFKQFIADASRDDLLTDGFMRDNQHNDHPVVRVSWEDAQVFIAWLNKKEGGNAYRLPTEAEWEYAARAGTSSKYSWGDSDSQADDYAWYYDNSGGSTHAVGGKRANPWGLYDMHGNALEWVQDRYAGDYYANSPSSDPQGPGSGRSRVDRGGGWGSHAWILRSAYRLNLLPGVRGDYVGFRLVRQP